MIKVGRWKIYAVLESVGANNAPEVLFPKFDASIFRDHPELNASPFLDLNTGRIITRIHSWLAISDDITVLIDTCVGNGKERPYPRMNNLDLPFLDRLAASGVQPPDVDIVINTHLHIDHVGWNTVLRNGRWEPTFPNARYILPRADLEYWRDPNGGRTHFPENMSCFPDSIDPLIDLGRADIVESDHQIAAGMRFSPAPGHSAGQCAVWLESDGESCVFSADVMHTPLQVYRPGWSTIFCEDPETANRTRLELLNRIADTGTLILPCHFDFPDGGRIGRLGDGFRYIPAPG